MTLRWRAQVGLSLSWVSLPLGLRRDKHQVTHRDVREVQTTAGLLLVAVTLERNAMKKIETGRAVGKAVYKNFLPTAGLAKD
mmetsp:Transcript_139265/g.277686  ORF Transcript_139265/g.277686 Transcript_139265/m.277686 type:complete len:82 (+) Transcript_139265:989-1234(+)